jgi:hypothetical protein
MLIHIQIIYIWSHYHYNSSPIYSIGKELRSIFLTCGPIGHLYRFLKPVIRMHPVSDCAASWFPDFCLPDNALPLSIPISVHRAQCHRAKCHRALCPCAQCPCALCPHSRFPRALCPVPPCPVLPCPAHFPVRCIGVLPATSYISIIASLLRYYVNCC